MNPRHPRICIGTVWYNDPSIFRMIESIPTAWEIIVVDGRWTGSSAETELSPKYLRDKIMKYPNTTILDRPDMLEYKSRDSYFQASEMFDILIAIDSDEWISEFNDELFYNYVNRLDGGMHMIETGNRSGSSSRLYVKPHEWSYYNSHKFLKNDGALIQINRPESIVNGIELSTNEDLRSEELKEIINKYQKWLWENEEKPI